MNNNIINKEEAIENLLSKEHFFQSLLQVLYSNNYLNKAEIEGIQFQILEILKENVIYYTKAESCSVRVEVAEQLMLSIYYTIGVYLKSKSSIRERIKLIKEDKMKELFLKGEKLLRIKLEEGKKLLEHVQKTKLKTGNIAYIETIDYGIPPFFKEYDIRFFSHEAPGSIDYPLAIDEMDLVGIEYILDYLTKLNYENMFCSNFDNEEIQFLLKGYDKNCDHLLINIFELVLTNYLGCVLIGKEGRNLNITEIDRYYLKNKIENLCEDELNIEIGLAAKRVCDNCSIKDNYLVNYISATTIKIIQEIKRNIIIDKLEKTFITLDNSSNNYIEYEDGKSMDNSKFKIITEEIRACSEVEDKIRIIKSEICSLKDLADILGADCIFGDEFIVIFRTLNELEITLLLKYLSNNLNTEIDYGTESEKEWKEEFKKYLNSFDETQKIKLIRAAEGISIQDL
ncbi:DUF6179 domain-containing protein [Clostridium sp. Maddingley MBC34-26]|nr:DUF6179 domain-containing protein [Clostridium sp. Maddingley MBC34-26]